MRGTDFFSSNRLKLKNTGNSKTCFACGLWKGKHNPRMKPYGKFKKGIMVCGEAPGSVEDRTGKPWQGPVGRILQRACKKFDVNLFEDCVSINSCLCRPTDKDGNNRAPTNQEIVNCRSTLLRTIEEYQPKLIMLMGGSAVTSLVGNRWQNDLGTISRWRDWAIPDRDYKAWLYATYHPSFTDRGDKETETVWMHDLERGLSLANKTFPTFVDEKKQVVIVNDYAFLRDLKSPFAFDFETTGLKPHNTNVHKIVSMSICDQPDRVYAFMMPEKGTRFFKMLQHVLHSERYAKIAQNMAFEDTWTYYMMDTTVRNWLWDPMIATHVLDNRSDICGLKFQVFVRFGLPDYSSNVSDYLKSKDSKNGNSVNRILELIRTEKGRRDLLVYNGLDSLFERKLAIKQMKALGAYHVQQKSTTEEVHTG